MDPYFEYEVTLESLEDFKKLYTSITAQDIFEAFEIISDDLENDPEFDNFEIVAVKKGPMLQPSDFPKQDDL